VRLHVTTYRDHDRVIDVRVDEHPVERRLIRNAHDVSQLIVLVLCKEPDRVHLHMESGLVFAPQLLDMLLKVRASLYVYIEGLAYTPHAENAETYRLLKERFHEEEGGHSFSRKLLRD